MWNRLGLLPVETCELNWQSEPAMRRYKPADLSGECVHRAQRKGALSFLCVAGHSGGTVRHSKSKFRSPDLAP